MTSVTIKVPPLTCNMTGTAFMVYAHRYHEVAEIWLANSVKDNRFDAVSYQLLCQALELHLKSFIWLKEQIGHRTIKNRYRHNLQKLWDHSKARGIDAFAATTPLRDRAIKLVSPYYKDRKFTYIDLDMIFRGFKNLKSEPKTISTLSRLNRQLNKSLRTPILRAS